MFDFAPASPVETTPAAQEIVWEIPLSEIATKHLETMSPMELDSDWRLNEFFGQIYVINLPEATKRLKRLKIEFEKIACNFKIFTAIDGRKSVDKEIWNKFYLDLHDVGKKEGGLERLHQSQAGCYLSHYKIILKVKKAFEQALQDFKSAKAEEDPEKMDQSIASLRKFSRVLIFEDDVGFGTINSDVVSMRGVGQILRKALITLPEDWDLFYFQVIPCQPVIRINPHIRKLGKTWGLIAYAVHYTAYQDIINHLKKIEDPSCNQILPVDDELSFLHDSHNAYAIYPSIVFHQAGVSTITDLEGKRSQSHAKWRKTQ